MAQLRSAPWAATQGSHSDVRDHEDHQAGADSLSALPNGKGKASNSNISPLELLIRRGNKVSKNVPLTEYEAPANGSGGVSYVEDGFGGFVMEKNNGSGSSSGDSSSTASSSAPYTGSSYPNSFNSSSETSRSGHSPSRKNGDYYAAPNDYVMPNAFRSSISSDISYNSITVDEEDRKLHRSIDWEAVRLQQAQAQVQGQQAQPQYYQSGSNPPATSSLQRRNSTDTVRTSDFSDEGRIGRLWSGRAADEESLYSIDSRIGAGLDDEADTARMINPRDWHIDIEGGSNGRQRYSQVGYPGQDAQRPAAATGGVNPGFMTMRGLDALKSLAQNANATPYAADEFRKKDYPTGADGVGQHRQMNGQKPEVAHAAATATRDRSQVVSIAGSLHGSVASWQDSEAGGDESDAGNRGSTYTIKAGGGNARDSVQTIRGSDEGPSVNVWPPTPQGSIDGVNENSFGTLRQAPSFDQHAQSADIETASLYSMESLSLEVPAAQTGPLASTSSVDSTGSANSYSTAGSGGSSGDDDFTTPLQAPLRNPSATSLPKYEQTINTAGSQPTGSRMAAPTVGGPISIAHALQHPLHTPVIGPGARPRKLSAGQAANDYRAHLRAAENSAYGNPNLPPGILPGSRRAKAIADHDGRESMVSDLDVETLRLDGSGSSRRGSFDTIRSAITIGTVDYSNMQSNPSSNTAAAAAAAAQAEANAISAAQQLQQEWRAQQKEQQAAFLHQQQGRSLQVRYSQVPGSPAPSSQTMQSHRTGGSDPESRAKRSQIGQDTKTGPPLAEEYLSQGIVYHEQGDMSRSAFYFERSAKVEGGCVVGMCMWGMALREGWGARKDPRKGFEWIQRAAARAGELSNKPVKSESELKAIRSELKLSVYELGKCYCYGWGTKMDKQTALEYFELAAKLGDADAQAEAGALYYAGKGCKKDLKKAAMYYRMAEKQGYDTVGLSWIWKEKYNT